MASSGVCVCVCPDAAGSPRRTAGHTPTRAHPAGMETWLQVRGRSQRFSADVLFLCSSSLSAASLQEEEEGDEDYEPVLLPPPDYSDVNPSKPALPETPPPQNTVSTEPDPLIRSPKHSHAWTCFTLKQHKAEPCCVPIFHQLWLTFLCRRTA